MAQQERKSWFIAGGLLAVLAAGGAGWWWYAQPTPPVTVVSGNGRLEAQAIDVATKFSGRIAEVLVKEGDLVEAGQVLVRMDTTSLTAQLRQAQAQVEMAKKQRLSAEALIAQRRSEELLAERDLGRARTLYANANLPLKELDRAQTSMRTATAARAQAEAQRAQAEASIQAAIAETQRLKADVDESVLRSPLGGRILYRLAEPSEVLPAGGKVLTLLDLTDVHMTIFLSETVAGRIAIGADARILLDAVPDYAIPAHVRFVAAEAQFTPKEVETRNEREKLMFRVKVQIDPQLLKAHEPQVKSGLPGVAYVRLDPQAEWPDHLLAKRAP